ncbi:MAG TPA: hypothetical protein VLV25_03865 [Steroidobacteraceae bacterium]|nr:hypothetical protein [Steroidobacteraceae bacterium]
MGSLQQRFEAFIRTVRGFESIDELLKDVHLEGKQRADYLLWDRQIIVEQKVLVKDPADKPQKFVNKLMSQGRIIVFGKVSSDYIFSRMPDGDEQKKRMFLSITKGLEAKFADADKQTRDTREILSIPDALGMVVILNESARTLHPDLIRYGSSQALLKRKDDGSIRYPHNDGVIMISEAHTDTSLPGGAAPCFSSPTPHTRSEQSVRTFSDSLVQAWATFNGLSFVRQEAFRI